MLNRWRIIYQSQIKEFYETLNWFILRMFTYEEFPFHVHMLRYHKCPLLPRTHSFKLWIEQKQMTTNFDALKFIEYQQLQTFFVYLLWNFASSHDFALVSFRDVHQMFIFLSHCFIIQCNFNIWMICISSSSGCKRCFIIFYPWCFAFIAFQSKWVRWLESCE